MHEYVNVSVSSFDPSALAQKLTDKSAEGWEVVAIVPTGSDVTAFLRRESSMAIGGARVETPVAAQPTPSPSPEPVSAPTPEPVNEPAGWAVAPEPTPMPAAASPATVIAGANADTSSSGAGGYGQQAGGYQGGGGYQPQQATPAAQAQPQAQAQPAQAQAQPSTPAGWDHDPSGRYELRYWDGSQWTEHVARGGQQYTDPPVA